MMNSKRPFLKRRREGLNVADALPEIGLAAIASYQKQKEVSDFINFMLEALERNSNWLNNIIDKQVHFRCVLMTGSGPNRFQVQEMIYPSDNEDIKLEVELNDSEDQDKVALAALLKLSNADIDNLVKYIKTRMYDNPMLKEDLQKGRALGISFAILRPLSEKQYRVMERVLIGREGNNQRTAEITKKRYKDDRSLSESIARKIRRKA